MKSSIIAKLEALQERHEEVEALLGDAGVIGNQERFRALSREYAQLSDVTRCFRDWQQVQDDVDTAEMLLEDPEMREMAQDELRVARDKREVLEQQLQERVAQQRQRPDRIGGRRFVGRGRRDGERRADDGAARQRGGGERSGAGSGSGGHDVLSGFLRRAVDPPSEAPGSG